MSPTPPTNFDEYLTPHEAAEQLERLSNELLAYGVDAQDLDELRLIGRRFHRHLVSPETPIQTGGIQPLSGNLKQRIRTAQVVALASVNRELVILYWNIGKQILTAQEAKGWGTKIVKKLSADLCEAFPGMKGFSPRNLDYMLAFAKAWPEEGILRQLVAKLPWGHNLRLMEAIADPLNFYLSAADDLLRTEGDAPSIGLILCQEKNRVMAEYALRDMSKPIGVSSYELTNALPERVRTVLPTIEELEQELSDPPD